MTLTPASTYRPALVFGLLLAALLLIEGVIVQLPEFTTYAALPGAVAFDLMVGIPALFYWQLIRRYQLSKVTLALAFGGALALSYVLLPGPYQHYLRWASYGLALAEALLVATALLNLRRLARAYTAASQHSADFFDNLTSAFTAATGRPCQLFVSEIALFRYAVLGWGSRVEQQAGQTAFSCYRNSGFSALLATACLLSVIETGAVHLLVQRWSLTVAWLLLVLDAYTLLFLVAHLHAVRLRPTLLTADGLLIRVGFVWRLTVAPHRLIGIQLITEAPSSASDLLNLARPLLAEPNLLLTFQEPVAVVGLYGVRRTVRRVALYVDSAAELAHTLQLLNRAS